MAVEAGWLSFWRVKRGRKIKPKSVYKALLDDKEPAALEDLPVDEIIAALKRRYPTFDPDAEFVEVDIPEEQTAIEPRWNRKHFHFTFFGDAFKQMDRVTKLITRLGLACYDAGTNRMYSVEAPPSFLGAPEEQLYFKALDNTLAKAADAARASIPDPQERLLKLKEFIESGAAKAALDEEMKRLRDRKKRKK